MKPDLVEAAHAAVKYFQYNSFLRTKDERNLIHRDKKRGIFTITRMMLTCVFAMLQSGEVFNPCGIQKFDMPEELRKRQVLSSAKDAVKLLVSLGVVSEGMISLEKLAS